jgi:hypothetical protein
MPTSPRGQPTLTWHHSAAVRSVTYKPLHRCSAALSLGAATVSASANANRAASPSLLQPPSAPSLLSTSLPPLLSSPTGSIRSTVARAVGGPAAVCALASPTGRCAANRASASARSAASPSLSAPLSCAPGPAFKVEGCSLSAEVPPAACGATPLPVHVVGAGVHLSPVPRGGRSSPPSPTLPQGRGGGLYPSGP